MPVAETAPAAVDVSQRMVVYFATIFYMLIISFAFSLITLAGLALTSTFIMKIGMRLTQLVAFGQGVMVVVGTVWRFNHEGKTCSGDFAFDANPNKELGSPYMVSSGLFMKVWMVLQLSMLGLFCCCACCICVCALAMGASAA